MDFSREAGRCLGSRGHGRLQAGVAALQARAILGRLQPLFAHLLAMLASASMPTGLPCGMDAAPVDAVGQCPAPQAQAQAALRQGIGADVVAAGVH